MIVWHRFFRFRYTNQDVNNPLSAIKGSVGVIIQGDEPSSLKIKIGHTLWTAKSAENTTYAKGSKVVVLSVEGVKLIVQAAHKE